MESRTTRPAPALTLAAALAVIGLTTTGCNGNDPRPSPTPTASVSYSATTPATAATADPAGDVVPLTGDAELRFQWSFAQGAAPADPSVEVAQRLIVLIDLGYGSPSWTDVAKIRTAAAALTTGKVVSEREIKWWSDPRKKPATGVMRVLIDAPQPHGSAVTLFTCTDLRGVPAITTGTTTDQTTRIELVEDNGAWRAVSYDNNASWTSPTERAFRERCAKFASLPNPMLSGSN
ncbi:hypothetical protein [Arthrobacter sp. NPDC090010]|uniref:hypothetical protein n=1 Tax=Arthrobacter sp. NPDC090010 TaxID=3363942 RepID=UPI00382DCCA3